MSLKSGKLGSTFVPRRVYFIKPTNLAEHIEKKNLKKKSIANVSYISVMGTDIGFNMSVVDCASKNCDSER